VDVELAYVAAALEIPAANAGNVTRRTTRADWDDEQRA
jgi:hypothetical protein